MSELRAMAEFLEKVGLTWNIKELVSQQSTLTNTHPYDPSSFLSIKKTC